VKSFLLLFRNELMFSDVTGFTASFEKKITGWKWSHA